MKNLILAALIAMTATSAQADMDYNHVGEEAAVSCVYEYYDRRSDVELTDFGKKTIDYAAQRYNLSNIFSHVDADWAQEKTEHTRQTVRNEIKRDFGKHAGEINYCFRQHMGG